MSTREFFQRGPSPLVRLAFFCALSIALMVLDVRYQAAEALRETLSIFVYPLEELVRLPTMVVQNAAEYLSAHETLQKSNQALQQQVIESAARSAESQSLLAEVNELRTLVHLPPKKDIDSVLAQVHHTGRNPFSAKMVIHFGSDSTIALGSPVMDAVGLIGQITHLGLTSAEVTLITGQNQQIPVKIARNGLRTLSEGDGPTGTLSLPFLPGGSDVQVGDQIVTSGIDGTYPEGLPVAQVSRVDHSANQLFAHVVCTPLAGVGSAHYVLVIQNRTDPVHP